MGRLFFGSPSDAPPLQLDTKIADLTEEARENFVRASLDVLTLDEMAPPGKFHLASHAVLAAIYLKSLGRSPVNLQTEYEIDRKAFVADLGRVLQKWMERVGELDKDAIPGNVIFDCWRRLIGPLFLDPVNFPRIALLVTSWLNFNSAEHEDRNRMAHHRP